MQDVKTFEKENRVTLTALFARIDETRDELISLLRDIAEAPAPTFQEQTRTALLLQRFPEVGLRQVHALPGGSVLGYTGDRSRPNTLLLAAHIDTVFPIETDLSTRVEGQVLHGPGTGDNAANVAVVLTLARLWNELGIRPARNVAIAGTVCEEGNGNLAGIAEVLDELGDRVDEVIAVDGYSSAVVTRSLAIHRYLLRTQGSGGHSWAHFGRASAVHELARIVAAVTSLSVPREPKTSFNVGTIRGGTSINAIAQECEAQVDLRSLDVDSLRELDSSFRRVVEEIPAAEVKTSVRLIGERPGASIPHDSPLVDTAVEAARLLGLDVDLDSASTDAALPLARGIPAVCFGTYLGRGVHTLEEQVQLDSLAPGLKRLALAVLMRTGLES
jgi:acetylornithine deacetylase/succinyl-diaminopimelate desuccinylase-like protein